MKSRIVVLCSLLLSLVCVSTSARAQWSLVHTFRGIVYSVYFLDDVGQPAVGLVGVDSRIFRTSDAGATWTQVGPAGGFGGTVTSFSFKNGTIGWCSIDGNTGPACYKTVDGGKSWSALTPMGAASHVYYNQSSKLLFLSNRALMLGTMTSADDGGSWQVVSANIGQNGFAFADAQAGVVSGAANATFLRTTDGGVTWKNLNYIKHCWSPCSTPTGAMYAPNDQTKDVYRSLDRGATWQFVATLPSDVSGCAQANACRIYVQTANSIYASTDGVSWSSINGPGNILDTRFQVADSYIYAGSSLGELWRYPLPSQLKPMFSPSTFHLTNKCVALDTVIELHNPNCDAVKLTKLTTADSNFVKIDDPGLPLTLQPDTIYHVRVHVLPSHLKGAVTAYLTLQGRGGTLDTTVTMSATVDSVLPLSLTISPERTFGVTPVCSATDTVLHFSNLLCDSMVLLSAKFQPANTGFYVLSPASFPRTVLAGASDSVEVGFSPPDALQEQSQLHLTFLVTGVVHDTVLQFKGSGVKVLNASTSPSALAFDSVTPCHAVQQTFYLKNSTCDSLLVTDLGLTKGAPFHLNGRSTPFWLHAQDSIMLPVQMSGDTSTGTYTDSVYATLNNGVQEKTYRVGLSGLLRSRIHNFAASLPSLTVDSLPPCGTVDTTIVFRNAGFCDTVRVDSLVMSGTGISIQAGQTMPQVLGEGGSITVRVQYAGGVGDVADGVLHVYGPGADTSIRVHISVSHDTAARVTVQSNANPFVLRACDLDSAVITLRNNYCSDVTIDSIEIVGAAAASDFVLADRPTLPYTLPRAQSIGLLVRVVPTGSGSGTARVRIHESSGESYEVPLQITIVPADTLSLVMAIVPGSSTQPQVKGDVKTVLRFTRAVTAADGLTTMRVVIGLNTDFLTSTQVLSANGWSATTEKIWRDSVQVLFIRTNPASITAGDELATMTFRASVADVEQTRITISTVVLQPDIATYMQCVLVPTTAAAIETRLSEQCGDSLLSLLLGGHSLIGNIAVRPNPATGADQVSLELQAATRTTVDLYLYDLLGREEWHGSSAVQAGANSIVLPASPLRTGVHMLSVQSGSERHTTRVSVER